MVPFLYIITLLSTVVGALVLLFSATGSQSAPQEAAGAAIAIGLAVIPYVFTRCVQLSNDFSHRRDTDSRIIKLLEERNGAPRNTRPE